MPRRLVSILAAAPAALALTLAACSGGSPTTSAPPTPGPASSSAATTAPASSGATSGPAGGGTQAPPVTDAGAVRDDLVQIASKADYSGPVKESGLLTAWQDAYPDMKATLFPDQKATPDTFSMADSFTFDQNASEGHGYDQILAFAVMDQSGTCAGGAVVIPQAADGTASDALPSVFEPVDMGGAPECTAEAAQDTYAAG